MRARQVNTTDSPALTGTPTAPTPAPGDNSTKIATTAFVAAAIVAADNSTIAISAAISSGNFL